MDISSTNAAAAHGDLFRDTRFTVVKALNIAGIGIDGAVKQQVFKTFDADQDGLVSADELAKLGNNDPDKLADRQATVSVFDRNGDGALDQQEFGASRLLDARNLKALLGVQDNAGVAGWLVSRADGDGDGALSADEYAKVAAPMQRARIDPDGKSISESLEEANARDFGQIDADQNGQLSVDELASNYQAGPRLLQFGDAGKATSVFTARNDTNGDGALSYDELTSAAKAAGLAATDVAGLIDAADRDGDAKLSAEELAMAAAQRPGAVKPFRESGLLSPLTPPSSGDVLLARLLRATVNGLGDRLAADLGGALNRSV
jgi:Ca2+-binding EF-hand superfamily protein